MRAQACPLVIVILIVTCSLLLMHGIELDFLLVIFAWFGLIWCVWSCKRGVCLVLLPRNSRSRLHWLICSQWLGLAHPANFKMASSTVTPGYPSSSARRPFPAWVLHFHWAGLGLFDFELPGEDKASCTSKLL